MGWFERTAKLMREKLKNNDQLPDSLETKKDYKERWRSIHIIYFTMFLMSLGFSIVLTGVWPYLDKLDPSADKQFMGFIVAANPLGQMLFSPLFGWWGNRLGSIRLPMIFSLILFTISSALYSCAELVDYNRKYWMLISRFFVGVSSANIAVCRSYLAAATRYSERTQGLTMISLAQVLGFIFGPAIQAAVVPLGSDGIWLIPNRLELNMYTATGWINVVIALITIYFYFPSIFKEHKIAGREAMLKQKKENIKDTYTKKPHFAIWTLLISFFIIVFNFMLLETLATPLTMDQFAWTKSESLKYMGILMSVGAVLSVITSLLIPYLSKKYSEVQVMIWGGFLFMLLGRALYIPFNNDVAPTFDSDLKLNLTYFCKGLETNPRSGPRYNISISDIPYLDEIFTRDNLSLHSLNKSTIQDITMNCGEDLLGCPSNQPWCSEIPALTITNFVIGFLLTATGYPLGVTLIQTIFSKLLGSRPQGVWMGFLTGAGCMSRVMGPVFLTYVYKFYGTIWTFGITAAMMAVVMVWLLYFAKSITPTEVVAADEEEGQELQDVPLGPPTLEKEIIKN